MHIISTREFRANQKKYFDLAVTEKVIIRRGRSQSFALVPTNDDELTINAALAAKIEQARAEIAAGHSITLEGHEAIDQSFERL